MSNSFSSFVKSTLVKQEVRRTVILPLKLVFSGWGKGIGYPTKAIMFGIGFIKMKRAALKYNVNFLNPNI